MSKVKGPLFSIIAMGTIDKSLTYRKRKGIDDVKKYTRTINPDTAGQQTQKSYFKNAIEAWSADEYSEADKIAWNRLASTKKVITSGFNRFTSLKIIAEKEGLTWNKLNNSTVYDIAETGFKVDVNVSSDLSGVLYLGTSKYSMLQEFIGVFSVDKYTFTITGLPDRTKVFFYVKNTSVGEGARTGIYQYFFIAGSAPPIPIDIGIDFTYQGSYTSGLKTHISKVNPANESGKITKVTIDARWFAMADCEVATFFNVGGNNYSTRDHELIGNVPVGKHDFNVDIEVAAGDFLGLYQSFVLGALSRKFSGNDMVLSSKQIPCTNVTFGNSTFTHNIYGIGTT